MRSLEFFAFVADKHKLRQTGKNSNLFCITSVLFDHGVHCEKFLCSPAL